MTEALSLSKLIISDLWQVDALTTSYEMMRLLRDKLHERIMKYVETIR
jgi:hypothetical protein